MILPVTITTTGINKLHKNTKHIKYTSFCICLISLIEAVVVKLATTERFNSSFNAFQICLLIVLACLSNNSTTQHQLLTSTLSLISLSAISNKIYSFFIIGLPSCWLSSFSFTSSYFLYRYRKRTFLYMYYTISYQQLYYSIYHIIKTGAPPARYGQRTLLSRFL